MDARITKQRLGNLLSYDWIKILAAIAVAILGLTLFFTMVRTRPRDGQTYLVYGYTGLNTGKRMLNFGDELMDRGVFSYDILDTGVESFEGNAYSTAAFSARRAAGEGTVMFVSGYIKDDGDPETEDVSSLDTLIRGYLTGSEEDPQLGLVYDLNNYFSAAERYLTRFFGEDLGGELDKAASRACFEARNGKDKRYRFSSAKFEQGVLDEEARLEKLRADFLEVRRLFNEGTYSFTEVTAGGKTYTVGIRMGKLASIGDLFYYTEDRGEEGTVRSVSELNLVVFNNGTRAEDLNYETFSLLRYLAEAYGA